jgi:hypothetical protein
MLQYTRRNGRFKLDIIAHPDFGLPFGQDRLVPIWVATRAVRQKSRMVLFQSAAEIPKDGPHYRRLVDGFKRIFARAGSLGTVCGIAGDSTSSIASGSGASPVRIPSMT